MLETICDRLNGEYTDELGEPFTTVGLCQYRDGTDSVAWHGDTIGRGLREDTMVAIVSIGATRTFALRPRLGGESIRSRKRPDRWGPGSACSTGLATCVRSAPPQPP
ncbi:DNA-N1-methyladenine dioxygenase [Mycobacteroides abscessus subsp. abscessus]|nr:DNA-N1-methyladenine dioxygenase [Mycobacteroides abscessus subsp. abscessus]